MPNNILHRICQNLSDDSLLALDAEMHHAETEVRTHDAPPGVSTVSWSGYVNDLTDLRKGLDGELDAREQNT